MILIEFRADSLEKPRSGIVRKNNKNTVQNFISRRPNYPERNVYFLAVLFVYCGAEFLVTSCAMHVMNHIMHTPQQ